MDTLRVDISYRPLRIGWAIRKNDIEAFRQAVRSSYSLWGGWFNPILVVDHEEEAKCIADLFQIDLVLPVGNSEKTESFISKFPYLINPLLPKQLFVNMRNEIGYCQALDVQNLFSYLQKKELWDKVSKSKLWIYEWQVDDPLSNLFLINFGSYPEVSKTGIEYLDMLFRLSGADKYTLDASSPIPADALQHPSIPFLSRYGLEGYNHNRSGWNCPGFFIGDSNNFDDLICYWNLRAADVALCFVDNKHLDRFSHIIPAWEAKIQHFVSGRPEWERVVGMWSRGKEKEKIQRYTDLKAMICHVTDGTWNGLNLCPAIMHFPSISNLGIIGRDGDDLEISFPLSEKPFCSDTRFFRQHLVASISFLGGLYGDEKRTLCPPYIPELNEFYSRSMHYSHDMLRIEHGQIGLIVYAAGTDVSLKALPIAELVEHVFDMAGLQVTPSNGGLITQQIISILGGIQGARVFKIPGVRRLIKSHGPRSTFTRRAAIQIISDKNSKNPESNFQNHHNLHIESRPMGTKLTPQDVFEFLVEKGLFRIGFKSICQMCRLPSWTALDSLKQTITCELCGVKYDASRQLVRGEFQYRRSGILGTQSDAQGAIPVALTLQQLGANLTATLEKQIYSTSLDVKPHTNTNIPECEIDFVWMIRGLYPDKTAVILGECKDQCEIEKNTITNLGRIADGFPPNRFETFILLSKLTSFTDDEISSAKSLNDRFHNRVILLTSRELEPYRFYERTKAEFDIPKYATSPEELANITAHIYFRDKSDSE